MIPQEPIDLSKTPEFAIELATHRRRKTAEELHQAIKNSLNTATNALDTLEKLRTTGIDPDIIYDEIVLPIREWTRVEMLKFQHGESEGYDTLEDIIEDTIYKTIGAIDGEHRSTVH